MQHKVSVEQNVYRASAFLLLRFETFHFRFVTFQLRGVGDAFASRRCREESGFWRLR
jgi:hypothetical protein